MRQTHPICTKVLRGGAWFVQNISGNQDVNFPQWCRDAAKVGGQTGHMNMMTPKPHPGDTVTAILMYQKALEFHQASDTLTGDAARLLALQAIEGYLIAYVRYHGMKNDDVRCLNHDLVQLVDKAGSCGLILRNRTHVHLSRISRTREYLFVRYGTSPHEDTSQPAALQSTLSEVMQKVGAILKRPDPKATA
jgi:hypothetical protein